MPKRRRRLRSRSRRADRPRRSAGTGRGCRPSARRSDRRSIQPMRLVRARADDAVEHGRVADSTHRSIVCRGEERDRPGVIIAIQGEDRKRAHRGEGATNAAGSAARKVLRVVDEVAVLGFLDRTPAADLGDPFGCGTARRPWRRRPDRPGFPRPPWFARQRCEGRPKLLTHRSTDCEPRRRAGWSNRVFAPIVVATTHSTTGRRPVTKRNAASSARGVLSVIVGGTEYSSR